MIIITWGGRKECLEVPEFVEEIYYVLTDQVKSDGEKLIAILEAIDGQQICVKNKVLKQIRNADIRAKFDSMLGGQPRLDVNVIKRRIGREYGLSLRQVENVLREVVAQQLFL